MKKKSVKSNVIYWILMVILNGGMVAQGAESEVLSTVSLEKRVEILERTVIKLGQQLDGGKHRSRINSEVSGKGQIDELALLSKNLDRENREQVWPRKNEYKKTGESEKIYAKITDLIKGKNYVKAQSEAESYIEDHPEGKDLPDVYFWLGEIKMLFGDLLESKVYYQKALELMQGRGRSSEVLLKLFVIAYQKGDREEGDYHFDKLQKNHPDSTAFHMAKLQKQKYKQEKSL